MTQTPVDELTFEQALQQLEQIMRTLEDGEVGLEQALEQYEIGVSLLKRCYARLQNAEQRIRQLTGVDAEGKPMSVPFEHSPTAESTLSESKSKRKKSPDPEVLF